MSCLACPARLAAARREAAGRPRLHLTSLPRVLGHRSTGARICVGRAIRRQRFGASCAARESCACRTATIQAVNPKKEGKGLFLSRPSRAASVCGCWSEGLQSTLGRAERVLGVCSAERDQRKHKPHSRREMEVPYPGSISGTWAPGAAACSQGPVEQGLPEAGGAK